MTIRAVVDPGVLVSALLSADGPPGQLFDAWRRFQFELVVSEHLLAELVDVLERPKIAKRVAVKERLAVRALLGEETLTYGDSTSSDSLTEDPDDDYLAKLALTSNAAFLVTGDKVLRRWKSEKVKVVTPREFIEILEASA